MNKESDKEKKSFFIDNWWVVLMSIWILSLALISISYSWNNAVEKDYLARITPEERFQIEDEKIQQQEINQKKIEDFVNGLYNFLFYPIPLIYVVVFFVTIRINRGRWI